MKINLDRGQDILEAFGEGKVLVIGDIMLDEFIWGKVNRISPEAPVPVVQVSSESVMPGGAANVVHNIRSLSGKAYVCGLVGKDSNGKRLKSLLSSEKVNTQGLVEDPQISTICKTRIIAHQQQVVRFDREDVHKPKKKNTEQILKHVRKLSNEIQAIIIEDYGKGVVSQELVTKIIEIASKKDIPVIIDPKQGHFMDFSGSTILTPNYHEAKSAIGISPDEDITLKELGQRLLKKWKSKAILVTLGEKGMALFQKGKSSFFQIPTVAKEVYDVSGAGDTVVAAFTLCLVSGATMEEAAIISNQAAGIVVAKLGTAVVEKDEMLKAIKENEEKSGSILRS